MNLKEQLDGILEPLVLGILMVWTVGTTIALWNPQSAQQRQGVVEIYSLTDANAGV